MRLSRPDAPQDLESAADRNRAARRSSRPLLDPHGIYGTRTAARQRAARRRQMMQSFVIVLAVVLLCGSALWWLKGQRVPRLARLERTDLGGRVAAPAARGKIKSAGVLVVPREDGSLLMQWSNSQPGNSHSGDGQSVWRTDFALRAAPLIAGDKVLAAAENGGVYAIEAGPGSRPRVPWKWFSPAAVSTTPAWFVPPARALAAPGAIVSPSASVAPLFVVADDDGTVAALRADTGARAWQQTVRAPVGQAIVAAPAGTLAGRLWLPLGAGTSGYEGGVACLEAHSGRVLWKLEAKAPVLPAPVIDATRERLYFSSDDGSIWALDARTGRKVWRAVIGPSATGDSGASAVVLRSSMALSGGGSRVVVGGNDGIIRCLNAADGAELWNFDLGTRICRSVTIVPLAEGREAVVCTGDSTLAWALDAASGAAVGRVGLSGVPRSVSVVDNGLEIVSQEGWSERFALPA